uniref:Uncharacterized protein n=1 Tax=Opuntia streptacantha TaxID=393608 RepID=A0A7C8ZM94_OPUST
MLGLPADCSLLERRNQETLIHSISHSLSFSNLLLQSLSLSLCPPRLSVCDGSNTITLLPGVLRPVVNHQHRPPLLNSEMEDESQSETVGTSTPAVVVYQLCMACC